LFVFLTCMYGICITNGCRFYGPTVTKWPHLPRQHWAAIAAAVTTMTH